MSEPKKGPGAPSKFKAEYCDKLREHCRKGGSFRSFAGLVGVNRDTIYHWENTIPEFAQAKSEAIELSYLHWERLGIVHVVSVTEYGENGKPSLSTSINPTMWIYNMKCRFPEDWRDDRDKDQGRAPLTASDVAEVGEFIEKSKEFLAKRKKK